jgi:hypothetical protein
VVKNGESLCPLVDYGACTRTKLPASLNFGEFFHDLMRRKAHFEHDGEAENSMRYVECCWLVANRGRVVLGSRPGHENTLSAAWLAPTQSR